MSKNVEARFFVKAVNTQALGIVTVGRTDGIHGTQTDVSLAAAYGPGNESWSEATPSGQIDMMITNDEAAKAFKPGKLYKVTFEEIEPGT